ncbi:MAG: hypothetical protein P8M03_02150 [Flavobacteriaceae bacterium]|nr:hypothetical protein [Flavobacteriaceae bacterium]
MKLIFSTSFYNNILSLLSLFIVFSCGNYRIASFYDNDPIYNSYSDNSSNPNNSVYKKYFNDLSNQNNQSKNGDIESNDSIIDRSIQSKGKYSVNGPWGSNISKTEIYLYNNPWSYYGSPYRSNWYNSYYSPFGYNYYNSYNWYGSYYSPFGYSYYYPGYNPFFYSYSPYGYSYYNHPFYGYYNHYYQYGYYNNSPYVSYNNSQNRILMSDRRGSKSYSDSSQRNGSKQNVESKENPNSNNNSSIISRLNFGRGIPTYPIPSLNSEKKPAKEIIDIYSGESRGSNIQKRNSSTNSVKNYPIYYSRSVAPYNSDASPNTSSKNIKPTKNSSYGRNNSYNRSSNYSGNSRGNNYSGSSNYSGNSRGSSSNGGSRSSSSSGRRN